MTRIAITSLACILFWFQTSAAQDALLTPAKDEMLIGPHQWITQVEGVEVKIRGTAFVRPEITDGQLVLTSRAIIDLGDLQRNAGALIDRIALPTNNCARFASDNLVIRIWGKKLSIAGNVATLELKGDAEVWACAKNPVPCTRIDWVDKDGPFGSVLRVPETRAYDCNPPMKTIALTQPFSASLPFELEVVEARTIGLKLGTPTVTLGGALGGVTQGVLRIAGMDVGSRAKALLEQAAGSSALRQSIPQEFAVLDPTITAAKLFDNSGSLAARVDFKVSTGAAGLNSLTDLLARAAAKKP